MEEGRGHKKGQRLELRRRRETKHTTVPTSPSLDSSEDCEWVPRILRAGRNWRVGLGGVVSWENQIRLKEHKWTKEEQTREKKI